MRMETKLKMYGNQVGKKEVAQTLRAHVNLQVDGTVHKGMGREGRLLHFFAYPEFIGGGEKFPLSAFPVNITN